MTGGSYRKSVADVNRISVTSPDIFYVERERDGQKLLVMETSNDRLRQARALAGFANAAEAARRFGWPLSTYRSHENGQTPVPPRNARKYGLAFKVSPGWILTGEGSAVGLDDLVKDKPISKQRAIREMVEIWLKN